MEKEIPSTDKTCCHGILCDKFNKCSRYIRNYKFDKEGYYTFIFNCNDRLFKKKNQKVKEILHPLI